MALTNVLDIRYLGNTKTGVANFNSGQAAGLSYCALSGELDESYIECEDIRHSGNYLTSKIDLKNLDTSKHYVWKSNASSWEKTYIELSVTYFNNNNIIYALSYSYASGGHWSVYTDSSYASDRKVNIYQNDFYTLPRNWEDIPNLYEDGGTNSNPKVLGFDAFLGSSTSSFCGIPGYLKMYRYYYSGVYNYQYGVWALSKNTSSANTNYPSVSITPTGKYAQDALKDNFVYQGARLQQSNQPRIPTLMYWTPYRISPSFLLPISVGSQGITVASNTTQYLTYNQVSINNSGSQWTYWWSNSSEDKWKYCGAPYLSYSVSNVKNSFSVLDTASSQTIDASNNTIRSWWYYNTPIPATMVSLDLSTTTTTTIDYPVSKVRYWGAHYWGIGYTASGSSPLNTWWSLHVAGNPTTSMVDIGVINERNGATGTNITSIYEIGTSLSDSTYVNIFDLGSDSFYQQYNTAIPSWASATTTGGFTLQKYAVKTVFQDQSHENWKAYYRGSNYQPAFGVRLGIQSAYSTSMTTYHYFPVYLQFATTASRVKVELGLGWSTMNTQGRTWLRPNSISESSSYTNKNLCIETEYLPTYFAGTLTGNKIVNSGAWTSFNKTGEGNFSAGPFYLAYHASRYGVEEGPINLVKAINFVSIYWRDALNDSSPMHYKPFTLIWGGHKDTLWNNSQTPTKLWMIPIDLCDESKSNRNATTCAYATYTYTKSKNIHFNPGTGNELVIDVSDDNQLPWWAFGELNNTAASSLGFEYAVYDLSDERIPLSAINFMTYRSADKQIVISYNHNFVLYTSGIKLHMYWKWSYDQLITMVNWDGYTNN